MLKNLDITNADLNLRKFKKIFKTINLMNDKDDRDRNDTGDRKAEDEVEASTVANDRNDSSNSAKRSRSVVPDKKFTSENFTRSDSRDNQDRNYYSNTFNNDPKNDYKRQKQGNLSKTFSRTVRKNYADSIDRSYVNDRTAHLNSTGNDFSSRNNFNQSRFSYFFILAELNKQANV